MSYVVLARKYRPRTFAQMAGQEHVVRALGNALRQRRLHHAYLFTGTRGIGKTTVSRILAKSLNCTGADGQGGITDQPCGVCSACTEIDSDRFIDYIEMDAASNRGIDEVRDMIERAAYKPSVGRFKVFMIDEAHQLTKDAFSALLKTLEEPPEYLKFVLATTDPEKMLPTVLSRCLQFNLRPMAPETVQTHLAQVLLAEGVTHDAGALHLLSRAARGSMRDALSLTDQAIAYGGGHFDEAVVRAMLGLSDSDVVVTLLKNLSQRDGAAMLGTVQELRERGTSFESTLEHMAAALQQMAVEQAVPGALPDVDPQTPVLRELAGGFSPEETQLLYSLALQGRQELALMSDESAAFSMILLRYLAFPPVGSAVPALSRTAPLRALAQAVMSVPVPARRAAPVEMPVQAASVARPGEPAPVPTRSAAVEPEDDSAGASSDSETIADTGLADSWNGLVRGLIDAGSISGLVRELAWQSVLVSQMPGKPAVWRLRVEHDALRTQGLRDKLAPAIGQAVGEAVLLETEAGVPAGSPARREAAERRRRQAQAEQTIQEDPVVRELMSQFKTAKIVSGSIKPL